LNQDTIKNSGLKFHPDFALFTFVINDDYKFFSHIFKNYRENFKVYNILGLSCIDYRRIDMLLLLLKHVNFDDNCKIEFINRCNYWGYDDIKKIIVEHKKIDI
jgi:hypothetical protein